MRIARTVSFAICLIVGCLFALSPVRAQVDADLDVRVDVEPPPLPVYDQPQIPGDGYLWVPGYWAWDDDTGYYWVPGTWVLPPEPELLWTPAYWGWDDGAYVYHAGYWGPHIGFYGGINYGFGYTGEGYEGGYWRGGAFFYNRTVNNITNVSVTNVYNRTVVVNNVTNVSYNGGAGGTTARSTQAQIAAASEHHVVATSEQVRHVEMASRDPALSLNRNGGHPAVAATGHAALFTGSGVIAAHPGQPVAAIAPQGHTISSAKASTTPGGKVLPGTATTTPGNKAVPNTLERKGTGGTPAGTGTAATTPSNQGPVNAQERKGAARARGSASAAPEAGSRCQEVQAG